MANQYPVYNGFVPSWVDHTCTVAIAGGDVGELITMDGIASFSSKSSLSIGEQREGAIVVAQTSGSVSQEASWELKRDPHDRFVEKLALAAEKLGFVRPDGAIQIGLVRFNLRFSFTPPGSSRIYEEKLGGCRYTSYSGDRKEGDDPDVISMDLKPMSHELILPGNKRIVLV